MKKFMIRCDMEGVSGIVSYEQAEPGRSSYDEGRRMFMEDLLALIQGLQEGGADEVHIFDEHYYGRNMILPELPEGVFTYQGKPLITPDWAGGLDDSFAGMILLGFHSKRGTTDALLNHTYEPDLADLRINGLSVGEIGIEAAMAGSVGVPMVMITGDSEGIREAKELVPGVAGVSVKESLGEFSAICYPTVTTSRWIRETAKAVAEQTAYPAPLDLDGDVTLEITFFPTEFARLYTEVYGTEPIRGPRVLDCWAEYQKRKVHIASLL